MLNWHLKINDPSGETRTIPLHGGMVLGRGESATILLRDPSVAIEAAVLWPCEMASNSPSYWIKAFPKTPPLLIGDLAVREAHLPPEVPVQIGETKITLQSQVKSNPFPPFPSSVKPWLTCTEEGRKVLWTAKKAAHTSLSIYLAGETGTGKEVLANLIHAWSDRKSGPFVPLHCGALPLSLAESELFGHVKGAFTGALSHRPGALMQAHGGTLFLDEVGDLPLDIQVKLLRFLENGEIRPLGSDRASRADVRILCATHHPLHRLVKEGKFRQDLYYRLASITINIPSLRSRPEDIELLARKFASQLERNLSPRALLRLQAHAWPGNVRELQHAIDRACGLSGAFTPVMSEDAFDFLLTPEHIIETPELELGSSVLNLEEMERLLVLKVLRLCHGHRTQAAKILGVARSTLFEMIKRHKIEGPRSQFFQVA